MKFENKTNNKMLILFTRKVFLEFKLHMYMYMYIYILYHFFYEIYSTPKPVDSILIAIDIYLDNSALLLYTGKSIRLKHV